MKKAIFYLLLLVLTGCEWQDPTLKTLKTCQKPTAITATANAANPRQYTFSLSGVTTDIAFPVTWKQGSTILGTSTSATYNYTFGSDGNFTITAEVTTVCGEKIALSTNTSIKTCQKPTAITATANATNPRQYTFVLSGVTTDVAFPVTWKQGSTTLGTSNNSTFGYTFGADGNFTITAEVTTVCGEKIILTVNTSVQNTSQTLLKVWDKTLGAGIVELRAIVQTQDGGFLLGGNSSSNKSDISGDPDKSENSRGGSDYWVVKINANGQKIWDKTFGGSRDERLFSLIAASDGSFYIGGYSQSTISGDRTEISRGLSDYWIVKIDANGRKIWDKAYGGNNSDEFSTMVSTSDGGILLGGTSSSSISGEKSENSRGVYVYWIVKINSNGQKVWDKSFGGDNADNLTSIISTSDGGFILGGFSLSNVSGDKTENSRGLSDYWIVKTNANGQKVWDKTFGGSGDDFLNSMTMNPDGSFLLCGTSNSNMSGEKNENSRGLSDYWVVKLNNSGQKIWDKTIGGTNYDNNSSIISMIDGGFLIGGSSQSNISGEKSENNRGGNSDDYWIVKISSNGQKQWDRTFGGSAIDYLYSILATSDGGFLLGGDSGSKISGDKSEESRGNSTFWVIKVK